MCVVRCLRRLYGCPNCLPHTGHIKDCLSAGATCPKSGVLPLGVPELYGEKALPEGTTGVAAHMEVLPEMREARVVGELDEEGWRISTTGMRAPGRTFSQPYKK